MSLPLIKSVVDSTDFSKTVSPYIPQLYDLPHQVLENITSLQGLKELYLSTNPLISAFAISLFLGPLFLVAAEVNRNYSQVDRFWSLLPTFYNAHFVLYAHAVGIPTARLDALLAFSTIWSARLTYNYWRKGGYNIGSEDYRWAVLRKNIGGPLFFVFDLVFISFTQSVLLLSVAFPTYVLLLASKATGEGLSTVDLVFSQGLVGLVMIAAIADQQQWNYQSAKKTYKETGRVPPSYRRSDLERGFNTSGLWAYSRHPNFAAEQSIWVTLYLWSCYVTHTYYHWAGVGALAYLVLFQGSTWFTELLSGQKYPEYKQYQKRVGMFVPGLGLGLPGDVGEKVGATGGQRKTK